MLASNSCPISCTRQCMLFAFMSGGAAIISGHMSIAEGIGEILYSRAVWLAFIWMVSGWRRGVAA